MAMVNFKKGLLANLPATKTAGTFYVTTDERAMYLDVDASTRIRLGDFQEFATVEALTANHNPNTTALYYVTDINCLAKWNGSEYVQINKDTGMTSVEVTGDGNAITAAVYNAAGRKLTLTKGATYMTAGDVDGKINAKVGELKIGETSYDTVKAYVDQKTSGIATDADLSELTGRVGTLEGKVDVEKVSAAISSSVSTAKTAVLGQTDGGADFAGTVKGAYEAAAAASDLAKTKTTMAEVEAKDYATKAQAQSYANAKDAAIAEAKAAADAAQADVNALQSTVEDVVEAVSVELNYTATGMAKSKTVKSLTQVDGQIAAEFEDIEIAQTQVTGLSDTLTALSGADSALSGRVKAIEDDYLKSADKTALSDAIADVKSDVDAFFASAEVGTAAIDTLKEIQDYIDTHGEAAAALTTKVGNLETTVGKAAEGETPATGLVKAVADNKAAIEAEVARATGKEAELAQADTDNLAAAKKYADDAITALKIGDYAKQADLNTHTGNTDIHITAAERTKWNAAEGKAHTHTNKDLLDTYTQTEENLADAVAKRHEHANATELDKIENGDKAKWDVVVADHLVAADKTELEGKITAAQTAAEGKVTELANGAVKANTDAIDDLQTNKADKATTLAGYGITNAYTKTETYTQAEVNALLTWDEF